MCDVNSGTRASSRSSTSVITSAAKTTNRQRCAYCRRTRSGDKVKLFGFPKDPLMCQKWAAETKRPYITSKTTEVLSKGYKLCSRHFEDKDYASVKKHRLHAFAFPQFPFANASALKKIKVDDWKEKLTMKLREKEPDIDVQSISHDVSSSDSEIHDTGSDFAFETATEMDNELLTTCDLHTGGEPLRIIESGYPPLIGNTILEKRKYAQTHLDRYRKLLMNEPRGHAGMYGAILTKPSHPAAHVGVLFIHNEGYSTMCGHAVIALGRYVVDNKMVTVTSPETEVVLECPCGLVRAFVECDDKHRSGKVRFYSVPAFVYKLDAEVCVEDLGTIKLDIAYGGAFYVLLNVNQINMDLQKTPLATLVDAASKVTEAVKVKIPLHHPESPDLAFLYGTILTDGKDHFSKEPTSNICIFADKQVDRSPTGSGVTARIALMYEKNLISLHQQRKFESLIHTFFTGKAIEETYCGSYKSVVVEVAGMAHYTGKHTFMLEESDPLRLGFQLS